MSRLVSRVEWHISRASRENSVDLSLACCSWRELKGQQMTSKPDYTDEEWVRLRRAPFVTGLAITIADPGGPIEMAKESVAALKAASTPAT